MPGFIAQLLKTLINLVVNRSLDLKRMVGSGNMPSSPRLHLCCHRLHRPDLRLAGPLFSLSAAVALVVMYDACNVRRAAGEQAKVLNYVREHWADLPEEFQGKKLNEAPGAPLPQVIMGAAGHRHWTGWADDLVNRLGDRAFRDVRDFLAGTVG